MPSQAPSLAAHSLAPSSHYSSYTHNNITEEKQHPMQMETPKFPLAGPGYVILNLVRVMNIISLLVVIAANIILLIKIVLAASFFFFEAVTHVAIFKAYFDRNWPLLGEDSGFVTLGSAMVLLGISTLGELNSPASRQKEIGLPFWKLILGAGVVSIVIGSLNIALSYVFRDSDIGISARHVRARGAVATQDVVSRKDSYRSFKLSHKSSLNTYKSSSTTSRLGSTRQTRHPQPPNGYPVHISSPMDAFSAPPTNASRSPVPMHMPMPMPSSEIAAPDLAHHPAMYSNYI
ncbi:hypothetical protein MGYG_01819 [Nannizzia gypsea CBS 118893]|uniref:DUF7598 domain-containing protein n=1 Tax=Arthroderma gypseum (strain ATCC MYA-4604 / CBS 118893) TaxID=535722 RepID=E5R3K4_ARTGP|nr:hypothetical protein MGYG_01819 [Nannizzia gypsea CBS 118893]EFQ98803.1 hypothetical protein MGYG_01819 [Nannizzia gypsea CBS 118893]